MTSRNRADGWELASGHMVPGAQSVLDVAGAPATYIAALWWLMFWVAAAVLVLVLSFVTAATVRATRGTRPTPA